MYRSDREGRTIQIANRLTEALPYRQRFIGKTVVIKQSGNAMESESLRHRFAHDIALLKTAGINSVMVHDGDLQIDVQLNRLKLRSHVVEGMWVTNSETMEVVHRVLGGWVNKEIVSQNSSKAIGLTVDHINTQIADGIIYGYGSMLPTIRCSTGGCEQRRPQPS